MIQGATIRRARAIRTAIETATIAVSLTVFLLLYATLGVVDFVLMRHFARLDPPPVDQPGGA